MEVYRRTQSDIDAELKPRVHELMEMSTNEFHSSSGRKVLSVIQNLVEEKAHTYQKTWKDHIDKLKKELGIKE